MAGPSLRIVRRPKNRRVLTAASQPITDPQNVFRSTLGTAVSSMDWQDDAWDAVDQVGELRYYLGWRAASCSRVRLVASDVDPDTGLPTGATDNRRVSDVVSQIAGGALGQSQLIRRMVECLTVPGEVWVAIIVAELAQTRWLALTREEIHRGTRGVEVELPEGGRHELNMAADSLFRIWNPRPRRASEPDSPVRATLDSLHEIVRTTKTISNASKSRLIGNGIVFVPQEMSLPSVSVPGLPGTGGGDLLIGTPAVQQLQELLWQVANTAYDDEDSMAALIPMLASVPGEQIPNVTHMKFDNQVTEVAIKVRNDAIARLAMGLDVSPERLLGLGSQSNHWCVDTQTEILTQRGWLRHNQLQVGDVALGLDPDSGLSTWTPVIDMYRAEVAAEPMLSMQTRTHSSLTTQGHRWLVNDYAGRARFTTSFSLVSSDAIPTAAPHADLPDTAKFSDDFVELVGWYWTEGNDGRSVSIAQSHTRNPGRVSRIRALLSRLYGPQSAQRMRPGVPAWREFIQPNHGSHGGPITVFRLSQAAAAGLRHWVPGKIVRPEFVQHLTRAQIELFIDVSAQGDGQHYRTGQLDMWQRDERALGAYELALILSGRMTQRQRSDGGHRVGVWRQGSVRPIKAAMNQTAARIEVVPYTGTVWCPVTGTGTWFARRDGKSFFTGNSAWQIADEDVQLHIAPVMETICQALNQQVLRAVFEREGIDPDAYMIWYDASQLTADPDKTENATAAFDRGAINAEAYRDFLGLGEDTGYDYTTIEGWQQWAQDHVSYKPELLPTLAPLLGGITDAFPEIAGPAALPEPPAIDQTPPDQPVQAEPGTENNPPPPESQVASAIVDLMVSRALELAGKRRRTRADMARLRDVPMHETHRYMPPVPDAEVARLVAGWDAALEDEVLARIGVDSDTVRAAVRAAVRRELTRQVVDA